MIRIEAAVVAAMLLLGCDKPGPTEPKLVKMSALMSADYDPLHGPRLILRQCRRSPCPLDTIYDPAVCRLVAVEDTYRRAEHAFRRLIPDAADFPNNESYVPDWNALELNLLGRRSGVPAGVSVSPHSFECEIEVESFEVARAITDLEEILSATKPISPSEPRPPRPGATAGP
jgi:hypothetical protein